ncbi:MAG: Shedu immune nuclease family protein [Gemmataceae bacterium]
MKSFERLRLDLSQCRKEVGQLRKWLGGKTRIAERKHILPFFRKRRHLSAFVASYRANVVRFNRIAFEFSLFGDFTCDLVVGDSVKNAYCFIEFEGAEPACLFVKQGRKATREWSPRFDHGFSQIVDWFYKLDDMRKSDAFAALFGARSITYKNILILGRDRDLLPGERERLEWRRNNVVVASQKIECVTFDELVEDLQDRLEMFPLSSQAGG